MADATFARIFSCATFALLSYASGIADVGAHPPALHSSPRFEPIWVKAVT